MADIRPTPGVTLKVLTNPPELIVMAFSRSTLLMLAQVASKLRKETLRSIDVPYMSMSARYADHVIGLALNSKTPEIKALAVLLRHDFFGPAGLYPGGRMLWSAPQLQRGLFDLADGPSTEDFAPPVPGSASSTILHGD